MLRTALAVGVFLLTVPRLVEACVCPTSGPCQKFLAADAVFTGVVTDVTQTGEGLQARSDTTILVEREFSGVGGQIVLTASGMGDCTYPFTVGQRYLVYARRLPDGTWTTSVCAGNKPLAQAAEDLDYLERRPPPGSGAWIDGRVRRIEPDLLDSRKSRNIFPPDVPVTLRDTAGTSRELRTDAQGRFEARGLEPGTYTISMAAPATARVSYWPETVALNGRNTCGSVSVTSESNGRIAGRIVDATGQPIAKVQVSAIPSAFTERRQFPAATMLMAVTDGDGRYEIGPLPAGNYQVGVNIDGPPKLELPYPALFHPDKPTRPQAETITLRDGELHAGTNFTLPRRLSPLRVVGTVVFPGGTPAPDVRVSLVGPAGELSTGRTDAAGIFVLTGLSESRYSVRAHFYGTPEGFGELTFTIADQPVTGLKVILRLSR